MGALPHNISDNEKYDVSHKMLIRQIKQASNETGDINLDLFVKLIDKAYIDSEKEREMSARTLALMSKELLERQRDISSSARRAGMAEVATSVLHNIGNILNSVNVSINLINEKLHESKIKNLEKSCELIKENSNNIGKFFEETEKGKLLLNYLMKVGESLGKEHSYIQDEVLKLEKNVQHIKSVVVFQQSMSKGTGFVEPVSITKLLDDMIEMNKQDFNSYGIVIDTKYDESIEMIYIDKIKLEQAIINLLQNSRDALLSNDEKNRKISLTTQKLNEAKIQIEVKDNGAGIDENNFSKIFSFGFTTKPNGHGFGLHTSAISIKELGGELKMSSEGLNKGATFTIELPIKEYKQDNVLPNHPGDK